MSIWFIDHCSFGSLCQALAAFFYLFSLKSRKLEMEQEFTTLIQEQKSTGERKLKAVQDAQKMTQAEMAAKSKILKEPVERMQRLLAEIDRLAQVANAQRNVDS